VNSTATTIDFTSFLKLMAHQRASDLFITAGMPPAMKVNGKISPITQTPLTPQQSRDLVLNVMTPAQREEFEKTTNATSPSACPASAASASAASTSATRSAWCCVASRRAFRPWKN
jgi:Tfp pilus assembly ATPase PilU